MTAGDDVAGAPAAPGTTEVDTQPTETDEDAEIQASPDAPVEAPLPTRLPSPEASTPPAVSRARSGERTRPVRAPPDPERARPARSQPPSRRVTGPRVRISGYLQTQYQGSQISEDELAPGGEPLNQDRFSVRRARLSFAAHWRFLSGEIEIDANTQRGAYLGPRRAYATLSWPRDATTGELPLVAVSIGLLDIPFGYELTQGAENRVFAERTTGSRALFVGEPDVGVRVAGALGPFRLAMAVLGGTPLDDRPGTLALDPTAAPDFVGRVSAEAEPATVVRLSGGVSWLTGTGFHAGDSPTKNHVEWRDINENGSVDGGELAAIPARAATPSETFPRWAVGADLQVSLRTPIGWSRLSAEVTLASDLDRGLLVADPVSRGRSLREIAAHVTLLQEVTPWAWVGARVEHYEPDADFLDDRRGRRVPSDASYLTVSPLVGVRYRHLASLVAQYDVVRDSLGRDPRGVPTDVANDRWTLRLQVSWP